MKKWSFLGYIDENNELIKFGLNSFSDKLIIDNVNAFMMKLATFDCYPFLIRKKVKSVLVYQNCIVRYATHIVKGSFFQVFFECGNTYGPYPYQTKKLFFHSFTQENKVHFRGFYNFDRNNYTYDGVFRDALTDKVLFDGEIIVKKDQNLVSILGM
jgi:hypothetical protein